MVRHNNPTERLTHELVQETPQEDRCPHLRIDSQGPYCGKSLAANASTTEARRMVCDHYSLQLFCLTKDRHQLCIFYNEEPLH